LGNGVTRGFVLLLETVDDETRDKMRAEGVVFDFDEMEENRRPSLRDEIISPGVGEDEFAVIEEVRRGGFAAGGSGGNGELGGSVGGSECKRFTAMFALPEYCAQATAPPASVTVKCAKQKTGRRGQ